MPNSHNQMKEQQWQNGYSQMKSEYAEDQI
jgi:hypothetical protein